MPITFARQNVQANITWKLTRVGVRADDIGAQRLEEACIPRDGGLRGGSPKPRNQPSNPETQKPTRAGVRADDIGAQRLEEARIPRDGGR